MVKIMNNESINKYIFYTILAIYFLATGGIFVKLSSLPPIATGFYRILFSIPLLYPFVKDEMKKIEFKNIILIILAGIFLALDLIFWNISFSFTTVANANLLANLVPFTIIPLSYFIYKKKFSISFILGGIITIVGLIVLMSGKINPTLENYKGDILAFITSIFYGLFLLTVSKIREKVSALSIIFISGFGGGITLFLTMLLKEGVQYPHSLSELYPLLGLALISQIFGQGLLSYTVGKVDVNLSSIIVLAQPIIATLYSYFLFSEVLSLQEFFGMGIILIGIYIAKKNF